jgi:hypothetical protein
MGQEQFEEWSDDDDDDEDADQNNGGFIQNFINNFNQWRGNNEEEKKE